MEDYEDDDDKTVIQSEADKKRVAKEILGDDFEDDTDFDTVWQE